MPRMVLIGKVKNQRNMAELESAGPVTTITSKRGYTISLRRRWLLLGKIGRILEGLLETVVF